MFKVSKGMQSSSRVCRRLLKPAEVGRGLLWSAEVCKN